MNTQDTSRLLVTGAFGHLGRAAVIHLLDTLKIPAERVIATSRRPETLSDLAARGVSVRAADFDDAASLPAAFAGADRVLLVSTDVLDRPGWRLAQHRAAIDAAAAAGVRHLVYTSVPEPAGAPLLFAPDHWGTEQHLAGSPLGWTVLRNHWYFENLYLSLAGIMASGRWYSAAGEGGIAHIARDDLALAAATALVNPPDGNQTLTLSGRESFTTAQIAALVSDAAGKSIELVPVPVQGLIDGMVAHGLPQPLAEIFASFDTNTAAGRVSQVTGDFRRLTGRDPLPYRDWLAQQRETIAAT